METPLQKMRIPVAFPIGLLLAFTVLSSLLLAVTPSRDPWTTAELITPDAFVKQLEGGAATKTHVACVAFNFMYKAAHIPGAVYIGPGRDTSAIRRLKAWASKLPKADPVLIYCGCCPMKECPNVRPAFMALKEMKFTHVMALDIPQNFARDWVSKGFPVQK